MLPRRVFLFYPPGKDPAIGARRYIDKRKIGCMTALKKKLVLVVEDDALIREFEVATLTRAGFEVLAAMDGIEGSALFARHFQEIDLLVTDISLPGMDGLEIAVYVRKIRPDVSILFASGSICPDYVAMIEQIPGARFLAKPFLPAELLLAITQLARIETHATTAGAAASVA